MFECVCIVEFGKRLRRRVEASEKEIERRICTQSNSYISPPKILYVRCVSVRWVFGCCFLIISISFKPIHFSYLFAQFAWIFCFVHIHICACVSISHISIEIAFDVSVYSCACKRHRFAKNGFKNRINGENQDLSLVISACIVACDRVSNRRREISFRIYCVRHRHKHSRIAKITQYIYTYATLYMLNQRR